MNKYEITQIIENIAPLETAEPWDNSGWLIDYKEKQEVENILLCLTITPDIINQAKAKNCGMIISHHPLFSVPVAYNQGIDIYCAHTNLDKATNGTTESLISILGFNINKELSHDFLRFVDTRTSINDLIDRLKLVSLNIRLTRTISEISEISRLAFCAGSGSEFWHDAKEMGAQVLITGDLKFHTAVDSEIPIIDIGHYESEIVVIDELADILGQKVNIKIAKEYSPIIQIDS